MDDSLEFMSLQHDALLSQLTASAERNTTLLGPLNSRREGGAIAVPTPCKPSAVFVDAHATAAQTPLASSYEQRQLYADLDASNEFDNANIQQLYFDTPTKGTSLSPSASFASFDDHSQVFAEFFATPLDEVVVQARAEPQALPFTMDTTVAPMGDWLEMSAPVDPNLGAILHEIRSEAAQIDQRSRDGGSQHSDMSTNVSDDDEFEAALIGHIDVESIPIGHDSDDEVESEAESSYMSEETSSSVKPKRKYSKRLGRPLTKDERRERKKAQNRAAAIRYRQKKVESQCSTEHTLHQLAKRNQQLKSTIKTTQAEIDIMKRLLNDVREAM